MDKLNIDSVEEMKGSNVKIINLSVLAKHELASAQDNVLSLYLRSSEPAGSQGLVVNAITNRVGYPIEDFLYNLAVSLDKIPLICAFGFPERELIPILSRLDLVDGTRESWGLLAAALLKGLEMELDKSDTMKRYPDEHWGCVFYDAHMKCNQAFYGGR